MVSRVPFSLRFSAAIELALEDPFYGTEDPRFLVQKKTDPFFGHLQKDIFSAEVVQTRTEGVIEGAKRRGLDVLALFRAEDVAYME